MFPREKTCGDGLTPRSVRQIADMGIEGALAGAHRFTGLRAHAFGRVLDLPWPEHPSFPSYGYVMTRHDLDAIVNERAVKAGATVWQGTEALEPILDHGPPPVAPGRRRRPAPLLRRRGGQGEGHRRHPRGPGPLRGGGRRGQLAVRPGPRHVTRPRPAHGDGPARVLHARPATTETFIESHLDIRDGDGKVVPGYGWIFPMGDGRVNVGVGPALHRPALEGGEHVDADGALRGLRPEGVGALAGHLPRPADRGQAPDGPGRRAPGRAPPPWWWAMPAVSINPFNGEGIAYGYESGRLAAASLGEALCGEGVEALRPLRVAAGGRLRALLTGWPGPSSG